jgi:hypothetical protein
MERTDKCNKLVYSYLYKQFIVLYKATLQYKYAAQMSLHDYPISHLYLPSLSHQSKRFQINTTSVYLSFHNLLTSHRLFLVSPLIHHTVVFAERGFTERVTFQKRFHPHWTREFILIYYYNFWFSSIFPEFLILFFYSL